MRPGRRQMWTQHRVGNEQDRDHRHDPAGCAPRRFEQQHDEDHAEDDVELGRRRGAVGEILPAPDRIDENRDANRRRRHVPHLDAIAEAGREREQQERQRQHESDVGIAQRLRRNDVVGSVKMKQRHHAGDHRDDDTSPANKPVRRALFLLDELLGLA